MRHVCCYFVRRLFNPLNFNEFPVRLSQRAETLKLVKNNFPFDVPLFKITFARMERLSWRFLSQHIYTNTIFFFSFIHLSHGIMAKEKPPELFICKKWTWLPVSQAYPVRVNVTLNFFSRSLWTDLGVGGFVSTRRAIWNE